MRDFPDRHPGAPDIRGPWRYLWWLVLDHRRALVLSGIFNAVWVAAQGLTPGLIGQAVNAGLLAGDQRALIWWGLAIVGLGVVQAVAAVLQDNFALSAKAGSGYQTLQFVTRRVSELGATMQRRASTGDLVTVGVSDINQIGRAMAAAARGVGGAVAFVVVATFMLLASWQVGLLVLLGVPGILLINTRSLRLLQRRQNQLRTGQSELTDQSVDIVRGLRILRGIGGEQLFARRYRDGSQELRSTAVRLAAVSAALGALNTFLPSLLLVGVVALCASRVLDGQLNAGQMIACYGYAAFLVVPVRRMTYAVSAVAQAKVAADHVTRLLRTQPELRPCPESDPSPGPEAGDVLADPLSGLLVTPSLFTAVVCGSDDAAALADRLGRYVDSPATWAGRPLAALPLAEVRRRILVGTADARLFAGELRAELDPEGRLEGSDDPLWEALDAASARDIVQALPEGLDTLVATGGQDFSGGQQQRLRLVRALMADPEVLILNDPTSAVDAHTESRIAAGLTRLRRGRTTVVLTTSVLLLGRADRVVLVADGRVVAEGSHEAMMDDARYRSTVERGMVTS
ncbi:ABC transporter ATP-binding protein [Kitasatospora nipponensis]|uniref:ABC transporter ATP-binding protein n=1 Tax=Kitasatospora nipponensis TaxID=258049 RepID=A0ABP4GNF8_9ACTN